jgi:hypothetical protein
MPLARLPKGIAPEGAPTKKQATCGILQGEGKPEIVVTG